MTFNNTTNNFFYYKTNLKERNRYIQINLKHEIDENWLY